MTSAISDPWGMILVGAFLSFILFGIILSQALEYMQSCEEDLLWQKAFVGILVTLDALSTALVMVWMYRLFIDGWGDLIAFETGTWLLASDPMLAGIIACMVQLFFAWRLQIISKQWWLTAFIAVCSVATVCGAVGTGIAVLWVEKFTLFQTFEPIVIVWEVSGVVADVTIAIAMTYYLRRYRGSFEATDRLLDRIILLTLQNGSLTALVAIVDLALYLATPKPYHIFLLFLMPKLYSNSVLSSLNARTSRRLLADATVDLGRRSADASAFSSIPSSAGDPNRPKVFVEIHEMTDSDSMDRSKC